MRAAVEVVPRTTRVPVVRQEIRVRVGTPAAPTKVVQGFLRAGPVQRLPALEAKAEPASPVGKVDKAPVVRAADNHRRAALQARQ